MISSNVSSIMANQVFMNNSAHNVANVNTDRFVPSNTQLSDAGNGAIKANTSKATDTSSTSSQTDLTKEIPDQISVLNSVKANVSAIKTQDEMFGSLLDIKA
jgi:flagellar hook protein FlgE